MTSLAQLQEELQETSAAIARAEQALVRHPYVPSVLATLKTIQKRHANLEQQFSEVASVAGLDVCRYRIDIEAAPPTVTGVSGVLLAFQKLVTAVYAAVKYAMPRQTTKTSAETIDETEFGFAYTFPGSLGIAMTLPNEITLLNRSYLDDAMLGVFDIMKARSTDDVKSVSNRFGMAAVRLAHNWATENTHAGFGAAISWQRRDDVRASIRVQRPEIARLRAAINETTEETDAEIVGQLVMVNTEEKKFMMRVNGDLIEGQFSDAISTVRSAELPKEHAALIRITKKILPAEGEPPVSYFLLNLLSS